MNTRNAANTAATNGRGIDRRPEVGQHEIDRINLEQALKDFETANARVVDLTSRLTLLHEQHLDLQHRFTMAQVTESPVTIAQLIAERDAARADADSVRSSTSFRLGNKLVRIARRIVP